MSENLDDFVKKLPTEEQAKVDALNDIANESESDGVQVPCYFGSAIVADEMTVRQLNILVPDTSSYEEAVGVAYISVKKEYPSEDGWAIENLHLEEDVVWADASRFD